MDCHALHFAFGLTIFAGFATGIGISLALPFTAFPKVSLFLFRFTTLPQTRKRPAGCPFYRDHLNMIVMAVSLLLLA
jgi:hypothetical protein